MKFTSMLLLLLLPSAAAPQKRISDRDLGERGLERIRKLEQQCSSRKQKACAELAAIASDRQSLLRTSAAIALHDDKRLAEIALNDEESFQQGIAVSYMKDRALLAEVARSARVPATRLDAARALQKLGDSSAAALLASGDADPEVRKVALALVSDQAGLAQVARTGRDPSARLSAIRKLTDQAVLAEAAKSGPTPEVRAAAVARLTDKSVLLAIAEKDDSAPVRLSAIRTVRDPQAVLRLVRGAQDCGIVEAAVGSIAASARAPQPVQRAGELDLELTTAFCHQGALLHPVIEQNLKQFLTVKPSGGDSGNPKLHLLITGQALSLAYNLGTRYSGAATAGVLLLDTSNGVAAVDCFEMRENPPEHYVEFAGRAAHLKPEDAPFGSTLMPELTWMLLEKVYRAAGDAGLTLIARRSFDRDLRIAALNSLSDAGFQAFLAGSTLAGLPEEALYRVADQEALRKLAGSSDVQWSLRKLAVARITDQAALARIAAEGQAEDAREMAAARLTDARALARIAKEDKSAAVRSAAQAKLYALNNVQSMMAAQRSDAARQKMLASTAESTESAYMHIAAAEKLKGADALFHIAITRKPLFDASARVVAASRIKDPGLIRELLRKSTEADVRAAALQGTTDTALLEELTTFGHSDVRLGAAWKITDQAALRRLATGSESTGVRTIAALKLTDAAVLAAVAKNDKYYSVSGAALLRLVDHPAIPDLQNAAAARCAAVVKTTLPRGPE